MTTDEALTIIAQQNRTLTSQNEMLIFLTARLVWKPEELVEIVMANKKKDKNPEAYVTVYNACDGRTTGKQLAEIAGVGQPTMSGVLQGWLEDGIREEEDGEESETAELRACSDRGCAGRANASRD